MIADDNEIKLLFPTASLMDSLYSYHKPTESDPHSYDSKLFDVLLGVRDERRREQLLEASSLLKYGQMRQELCDSFYNKRPIERSSLAEFATREATTTVLDSGT